jgi:hypothetical protein
MMMIMIMVVVAVVVVVVMWTPKYSEKTCSSVNLPTTNPTQSNLSLSLGRRRGKPGTNRLSYDTAFLLLTVLN